MLAAIELLREHRRSVEKLQPNHPDLPLINDLILHGLISVDQTSHGFVNLPQLLSPEDSSLVEKYRSIFGMLGDSTLCYQAEVYFHAQRGQFTQAEKVLISLGFNRARSAIERRPTWDRGRSNESVTLGEVRRVSPEELVASKMIQIKRALIFLHAIQFTDQSNP